MDIRIGNGYDVHALAEGLPMWLGGVQIPSTTGFVAHSDGDVAIHALCDALLGCLALGDIGHLSSPRVLPASWSSMCAGPANACSTTAS